MKVYIAGPLFNESERKANIFLRDLLLGWGYETHLPQEEAGIGFALIKNELDREVVREKIFENDVAGVKNCDIFLCVLDGRVPDEGACVELGMAYALGKPCVGYKTDQRTMDKYGENIMVEQCLLGVAKDILELKNLLDIHARTPKTLR